MSSTPRPMPDDDPDREAAARRFALAFVVAAAVLFFGLIGAIVALDPYDTGRFALVTKAGVPSQGPRTAHASRGRDPAYDGAIVGNSHLQLLSPERLAAMTGVPFVSLTVPATGPQEQLALLDYWLRHRSRPPRVLVIGIDGYWCRAEPDMPVWKPFPFWLYADGARDYLRGMARFQVLEEVPRRLRYLAGAIPRARPDGYWNYEEDYGALAQANNGLMPALDRPIATIGVNLTGRFPPREALAERLARLPATTRVVLIRPPVHAVGLPAPGSPEARTDADCAAAYATLAASRPGVTLIDGRVDTPTVRNAALWFDPTHYRSPVARELEAAIASALAR